MGKKAEKQNFSVNFTPQCILVADRQMDYWVDEEALGGYFNRTIS